MVIFGATGDLTGRKLIPALYNLAKEGLLSRKFKLVGAAVDALDTEAFRCYLRTAIERYASSDLDLAVWESFENQVHYVQGDFQDPAFYQKIKSLCADLSSDSEIPPNLLYYFATSPTYFGKIVAQLGAAGLARESEGCWRRVIIEKPFGHDLDSARELNADIRKTLEEHQIYRIDHYLGKETVQNILVLRFANSIFEPVWNRRYIDHVQITAAEPLGVERRGGYYENAGALRDMMPNHLFQLLSLTAMEPPVSFDADAVRDEQIKVLAAIRVPTHEDVLRITARGQYGEGEVNGERVRAYRDEFNVAPTSSVETFAALTLDVDNWRWADVPFYLRTGKRMPKRMTEIVIQFRRPPLMLFKDTAVGELQPNRLIIQLQPEEGISIRFGAKVPGPQMKIGTVKMDFDYEDYFGLSANTGYERLLLDAMIGDQTLFQRADMVEAGWSLIQPVLDVWKALPPRTFPNYAAGTWGPKEADDLLRRSGRSWHN